MSALWSQVLPVSELDGGTCERLFALLSASYDCVSRERFLEDLSWKDEVILLKDGAGEIQGFTTLAFNPKGLCLPEGDVLFSGDTIIDPGHWGGTELVRAFCHRAGEWQSQHGRRLFWMLISKGHRTYLFLPIFSKRFHPHPERGEPELKGIADQAAGQLFGKDWDPNAGVLRFGQSLGHLKPALAEGSWRRGGRPMVGFFLQQNPGFAEGDELVCLTELAPGNLKRAALRGFEEGILACV